MSRGIARCLAILALLVGVAVFAKAGNASAADSVNGSLKATGKAGSGEITLTISGTTGGPNSTVQIDYHVWNGAMGWQYSGFATVHGVNGLVFKALARRPGHPETQKMAFRAATHLLFKRFTL